MIQPVIELKGLTKQYGSFTAVDHLDLAVPEGEVFGLLGPNGAGKSTTILMMIGLTEPTSGSVSVCGIDSTSQPVEVKRKVGYLPEDIGFYDDLSGLENLAYTARLNGLAGEEALRKAAEVLERVGLGEQGAKKAGKYSRGMRQRLGLADVLIKDPRVIILDEPTLGLDPAGVREFLQLIAGLSKESGLTVLLSSHHLHQVQQVCDRVGLFVGGKLIADGTVQQLSRKLFPDEQFVIEAGISPAADNAGPAADLRRRLEKALSGIEGVVRINGSGDRLQVSCSRDATADIARVIVTSGAGLNYLKKKEYGLDDIYHRYFQGGNDHE